MFAVVGMADTSGSGAEGTETTAGERPPPQNGLENGADDEEYAEDKSKVRPADIDADMREMERRKRVELIMNSRLFREELERIIETQLRDGGTAPSGLLQQISDMMGELHFRYMF